MTMNSADTMAKDNKQQADSMAKDAKQTAESLSKDAKQTGQQLGEQARQTWHDVKEDPSPKGIMETMEQLPANTYMFAALGSIGLSLVFRLLGRKDFANFIGLWPPTIVALALLNKQFRPSKEM